jgi:hypothetical protein
MLDAAVEGLETSMGLTAAHKKNAAASLDILRAGRDAETYSGASVNGIHYNVDHVERDGDVRKVHLYRKNESGMMEHKVVHEEQSSEGTYVSKEIRRGY